MANHEAADVWVLEWSHDLNDVRLQPQARLLGMDMARFILHAEAPGDYVPLAVGRFDEISAAADIARSQLAERAQEARHG